MPLACASDYRCRNLCFSEADCNVLGITGRVCAEDAQHVDYCAEAAEVTDGVLSTSPPNGALSNVRVIEPSGGDPAFISPKGAIASSIGALGGTLGIGDVSVTIPPGALDDELVIAIVPIEAPLPGSVGQAYEFLPTGTEFDKPVTVSFAYTDDELAGRPPSAFAVSTVSDDSWQAISKSQVDSFASVISGMTRHFSPYALVATSENGSGGAAGASDDSGGSAGASTTSAGASTTSGGAEGAGRAGEGPEATGATGGKGGKGGTGVHTGGASAGGACSAGPGAPASPVGVASSIDTTVSGSPINVVDGYAVLKSVVNSGPLSTSYVTTLSLFFTDYANASGYYQVPANKPGSRTLQLEDVTLQSPTTQPEFAPGTYKPARFTLSGYDSQCQVQSAIAICPTSSSSAAPLTITAISATRIAGSAVVAGSSSSGCNFEGTTNISIAFDVPIVVPQTNLTLAQACCLP